MIVIIEVIHEDKAIYNMLYTRTKPTDDTPHPLTNEQSNASPTPQNIAGRARQYVLTAYYTYHDLQLANDGYGTTCEHTIVAMAGLCLQ
jgi:hypothetical protein